MIAYLSGGMENAKEDGKKWRQEITIWLERNIGHTVIDPVILSKKLAIKHNANDYRKWKISDPEKFIKYFRLVIDQDLKGIVMQADYIICLWDQTVLNGAGTHGEVTIAYYEGKPIYLINKLSKANLSGWIMSCATNIIPDFTSLKKILIKNYSNAKNRT